jgi:hypothetical protein
MRIFVFSALTYIYHAQNECSELGAGGVLWEYERETEHRYLKFSILKFLYKHVETNGDVTYRLFGIKL